MIPKTILYLLPYYLCVLCVPGIGQTFLFFKDNGHKTIHKQFDRIGGLIITEVGINGLPLKMIFDTGAQQNLLFKKQLGQTLDLSYERTIKTHGADRSQQLIAHFARVERMELLDDAQASSSVMVLEEDYLGLDRILGTPIDGIIGSITFSNSVVHVNNRRQYIEFIPFEQFQPPKNYYYFPIQIEDSRPFVHAWVTSMNGDRKLLKFLLDTGSSIPLLLYTDDSSSVMLPDKLIPGHLGVGIGGDLRGYVGRVERLEFGEYDFEHFPVSFQVIGQNKDSMRLYPTDRDGIIGNGILSRFNYFIDFNTDIIYFKPNKKYKNQFKYDKSGLNLIAGGAQFEHIIVHSVIPKSPAAVADIRAGDRILSCQGWSTKFYTLSTMQNKLSKRSGKLIKLKIERQGNILHKSFRLQELF